MFRRFYNYIKDMNNESQYECKSYLDILPNDILHYMFINEYLSPKLNIMWNNISSLNKEILKIPNNTRKDSFINEERNIDEILRRIRIYKDITMGIT